MGDHEDHELSITSEASEWDELEARSLVFAEIDGPQERLTSKRNYGTSYRWKQITVLLVLGVCAFMLYLKEDVIAVLMMDVEKKNEITAKDRKGDMEAKVMDARRKFQQILDEDYGPYKDDIFNSNVVKEYFQSPSQLSVDRLQRRITIKILEAYFSNPATNKKNVEFNWVIGGHSAAAGHGNLYNQTYAHVLEETVRPIFEALDITFYGKNYAMGGMKSAPESALCMSSLYGVDIDILSWDFGMTDGSRDGNLYNIWAQRAGVHPTRPIIISYGSIAAQNIHANAERDGMATFDAVFVQEKSTFNAKGKLPNSDDEDVNADELPRGVKNYICKGSAESGEPCGDKKLKFDTVNVCPVIGYQVSWHNGWKDHLLKGRVSAAFLIQNTMEALDILVSGGDNDKDDEGVSPSLTKEYLEYLYTLETKDKELFLSSELPPVTHFTGELQDHHEHFLRKNLICRYSYLPSYTRYNGIVTESHQELDYMGSGRTTYRNEGINALREGEYTPKPDHDSPLALYYNYRNDRKICDMAEFDFKDYFGIKNEDKWVVTVVPNDSENIAFSDSKEDGDSESESEINNTNEKRLGLITLCERFFAFSNLPEDYVSIEQLFKPDDEIPSILVNDIAVANATRIGTRMSYCYVLYHNEISSGESKYIFPSTSEEHGEGRFDLRFQVPERGGQVYLSSIIVI